jgi:cell division protein FtsQ
MNPRPPMDPRLRERGLLVRREQGRRRLRWILAALAVVAAGAAVVGTILSPILDVNRIELGGVPVEHRADARRAIGVDPGEALLLLDTGAVAARLEAEPWVQRATVVRDLPGTLRIRVVARVAVAWTRTDAGHRPGSPSSRSCRPRRPGWPRR